MIIQTQPADYAHLKRLFESDLRWAMGRLKVAENDVVSGNKELYWKGVTVTLQAVIDDITAIGDL